MSYTFTARIGHDVDGEADALTAPLIVETARRVLGFGGCTAWEARGYWRGGYEETTVIEICGLGETEAGALMERLPELAAALDQTSVYGSIQEGRCEERFASERGIETEAA
jgi:hypothetical protein